MADMRQTTLEAFERATAEHNNDEFVLQLYVAGMSPRSLRAVQHIHQLCEEHLAGRYELQVIDIYEQPQMAEAGQVIAAPTLVRTLPEPLRRVVGDLGDEGRVLLALGVKPRL